MTEEALEVLIQTPDLPMPPETVRRIGGDTDPQSQACMLRSPIRERCTGALFSEASHSIWRRP